MKISTWPKTFKTLHNWKKAQVKLKIHILFSFSGRLEKLCFGVFVVMFIENKVTDLF